MTITLGLSLSLSGAYAAMGRQAEAALRMLVAEVNAAGGVTMGGDRVEVALRCIDDASEPARCAEIYRTLVGEDRDTILLGPYSSNLTAVAAPIAEQAHRVLFNHGGAADELYDRGYRMIVGVATPASEYLTGFVRLLAGLKFWRKRLAIVAAPTPFARAVAGGVERACGERAARRRGIRVRVKWNGEFDPGRTPDALFPAIRRNRVNALVSAGSYAHDLAVMRAVAESPRLNVPVLACVAAGVAQFRADLGEHAEGIVGASQWEPDAPLEPEIGPSPHQFARRIDAAAGIAEPDYVAAQAYGGGLIALAALRMTGSSDQDAIRAACSDLRTTTTFGEFALDRVTGRQIGHRMLLVQWHLGRKVIIEPESHDEGGSLEFPSGWRLITAGLGMLRLNRSGDEDDDASEDEHDEHKDD